MPVFKARRSLKTLPRLPPSQFDRKIHRRRRIVTVSIHRSAPSHTVHGQAIPAVPAVRHVHPAMYDSEFIEQPWPAVRAAAEFHPALYMVIRDPIFPTIADGETIERAWASASKALKTFTDICYRSYLDPTVTFYRSFNLHDTESHWCTLGR